MVIMSETITPLIEVPTVARGAPTLTVVVPCYNERPNVAPLIARLDAALYGIAWEVVYVDDNSPDGTTAEVRRIAQADRSEERRVGKECGTRWRYRRRHTRLTCDWSSDVCSSDLPHRRARRSDADRGGALLQ